MIVYASRTGNNKNIAERISHKGVRVLEMEESLVVNEPYFLLTYTDGLGEVPNKVYDFLKVDNNVKNLKGVIASGNTNFGHSYFCYSADIISKQFNVPIIKKIELRGYESDIVDIVKKYNELIKED